MRLFPIVTAAIVVLALYFWIFERERVVDLAGGVPARAVESLPPEAEAEPFPVVAIRSEAQAVDTAVLLRGRTEAARQVEVRAETSGRVVSEPLRKGSEVVADDLLCRLDPGTRRAALAEAEARIPEAEARVSEALARLREAEISSRAADRLREEGFSTEMQVAATDAGIEAARAGVESARAGLTAARAAREAAGEELGRLEIRAPFAGLLESDTAEIGTLLQPGSLCATIVQLDPMKLVGFVPEIGVQRVEVGAPASARLASDQRIAGRVIFLSRAADPTTRTFRVEVEVANPDLAIRDGQTAEILIAAEGERAHLLPQSALTLGDDGALGVRLVRPGRQAGFAPVAVLRDTPQGIWVTGLDERAEVIVVGQEYVIDGVPVRPDYREARP